MRLSSRRNDDADVIRARLRALLDDRAQSAGWVPEDVDGHVPSVEVPPRSTGDDDDADPAGLPESLGRHRAPGPTARWDPGLRGARALWVVGVVAALLLVGWTWLQRPSLELAPEGEEHAVAETSTPAAPSVGEVGQTSATVVVSVVGLVARPGLVTLPSGSRVADAVEAAGGLLPEADPATVNLAAVVADGQQIAVGVPGQAAPSGGPGDGAGAPPAAGGLLNLNTASVSELDSLPGLGPVLAQRIVDHRTQQGGFRSVDELEDVPGIGPATFAEISERVTV